VRKRLKAPLSLRDILPQALKPQGMNLKVGLYQLEQKWPALVGELLDRKSRPLRLQGKRLFIGVAGSSWANEMEYLRPVLLEKIRKEMPELGITDIRFQIVTSPLAST
jgi:predicted nucleic acid-binding Zn ribbon protein